MFAFTPRYSWVDKQEFNIFNNIHTPNYGRTDYTLSWTSTDSVWKIIAYMKNATGDENYNAIGIGTRQAGGLGFTAPLNSITASNNPPRQYGVELLFKY